MVRRVKLRKIFAPVLFVASLGVAFAPAGCTSLLGDFDVASTSSNSDGGPGGGSETGAPGDCTVCGGECVDTRTSQAHCGRCDNACDSGQACNAGTCVCLADSNVCDGRCYARTDRAKCGPSCAPCQADEVCNGRCEPAPLPEFASLPRDPTGWLRPDGSPLAIAIKPTNVPGTIYECRTGPAASFTPQSPPWGPCDGQSGTEPIHLPSPSSSAPEGTYRTEYRFRSDTFRSSTVGVRYYVHRSLDRVATCPPANAPRAFTDDEIFEVARQFSAQNTAIFDSSRTFPAPSNSPSRTDAIVVANPFLKIPFTNVVTSPGMLAGARLGWSAPGGDYTLNERSLRHQYVLSPTRNFLLVRRQYVHPKTGSCEQLVRIGSPRSARLYGPGDRGVRRIACEALVLNTRGQAICVGRTSDTANAPAVLPIDAVPPATGFTPGGTVTVVNGSPRVVTTNVTLSDTRNLVQIPRGGRWYRIRSVEALAITLTEPYQGGNATYTQGNWTAAVPQLVYDIPTGYAKLVSDASVYATGARGPGWPAPKTKCERAGCNDNKPWLTYLPP
jgi:hypothetical protein